MLDANVPILYGRTNMKVKSITVRVTRKYLKYKDLRAKYCNLHQLKIFVGETVHVGSKIKISTNGGGKKWKISCDVYGDWLSDNHYGMGLSVYQAAILTKIFPR